MYTRRSRRCGAAAGATCPVMYLRLMRILHIWAVCNKNKHLSVSVKSHWRKNKMYTYEKYSNTNVIGKRGSFLLMWRTRARSPWWINHIASMREWARLFGSGKRRLFSNKLKLWKVVMRCAFGTCKFSHIVVHKIDVISLRHWRIIYFVSWNLRAMWSIYTYIHFFLQFLNWMELNWNRTLFLENGHYKTRLKKFEHNLFWVFTAGT